MIASQHDLPDLSSLARTSFLQLALAQRFEGRAWAEPLNLQLLMTARLLDKAITDYERARVAFDEHDQQTDGLPDFFQPHKRGVTVRYIQAIGHIEDLVAALDRTLRTLPALVAAPQLESLKGQPLPDEEAADRVRKFRTRSPTATRPSPRASRACSGRMPKGWNSSAGGLSFPS